MAQPTTQLNATEQDTLVKQIGLALLRAAPRDWRRVTAHYRAVGRYHELTGEVVLEDGNVAEWMATHDITTLFGRLRAGMYREGRGTWFNAHYQLDHPSSYNLEYDREEPHWDLQPPPQAYVDELRMFPRSEENVPDWLMRRMSGLGPEQSGPRFRIARIFDGQGPDGRPIINRPEIDADERDRVLTYLNTAPVVLSERGLDLDRLASPPTPKVPVAYHTDGTWIWPAATNYYLNEYGIAPEADLVAHIRGTGFGAAEVSEQTLQAANAYLTRGNQPAAPMPSRSAVPEQAAGEPGTEDHAEAPRETRPEITRPEFESDTSAAEETRVAVPAEAVRSGSGAPSPEADAVSGGEGSPSPGARAAAEAGAGAVDMARALAPDTPGRAPGQAPDAEPGHGADFDQPGPEFGQPETPPLDYGRELPPRSAFGRDESDHDDPDQTEPGRTDITGLGRGERGRPQPAADFGRGEQGGPDRPDFGRGEQGGPDFGHGERGGPDFGHGEQDRPEFGHGHDAPDQGHGQAGPDLGRGDRDRRDFGGDEQEHPDFGRGQPGFGGTDEDRPDFGRGEQDRPGFRGGDQDRPGFRGDQDGPDFRGDQDGPDFRSSDRERPEFARGGHDQPGFAPGGQGRPDFGRAGRGGPGFGQQDAAHAETGHPDFAHEKSRSEFGRDPQADFGRDPQSGSERDPQSEFGREARPEFGREQGQPESGRRRAPEPASGDYAAGTQSDFAPAAPGAFRGPDSRADHTGRDEYAAPGEFADAQTAAAAAVRGDYATTANAQGAYATMAEDRGGNPAAGDPRGGQAAATDPRGGHAAAADTRGGHAADVQPDYAANDPRSGHAADVQADYAATDPRLGHVTDPRDDYAAADAQAGHAADPRSGDYATAGPRRGNPGDPLGNPADPRGNPANARGNPADPDGDPSITDPRGGQAADARGDYAAAAAGPHGDFGRGGYDTGEQAADQPRPPVEQPTTFTPAVDLSAGAPTQVQPAIKDEPEAPFAANPSSTRLVPPASPRLAPQPAPEHPEPAVNTLRTRLRDLGIPESAYRIGEPAEHGWSMEQVDAGWRVGWYDDKLTNPAVFGDPEDAAAFMLGKLLLDPRGREASPSSISVPIPNAISVTGGERPDAAPVNGGRRSRVEEPDPVHQAPESVAERLEEPALGAPPTMLSPPVAPPPARREPQRREPARPAASSAQNGSSQWPIQPLPGEPPLTLFRGKEMRELPPGSELDRFGAPNGNLTYVAGTPFEERSLVPEWVSRPYHVYRVQRPLEALAGVAIPWFNQPGGGSAYLLPASIEELVAEGDLIELDPGEPPID